MKKKQRIEMYLRSLEDQKVEIKNADLKVNINKKRINPHRAIHTNIPFLK